MHSLMFRSIFKFIIRNNAKLPPNHYFRGSLRVVSPPISPNKPILSTISGEKPTLVSVSYPIKCGLATIWA